MTRVLITDPPLLTGRLAAVHVRAAKAHKVSVTHVDAALRPALLVVRSGLGDIFGLHCLTGLGHNAGLLLEEDDVALPVLGLGQTSLGAVDGLAAPDGEDDDDDHTEDDQAAAYHHPRHHVLAQPLEEGGVPPG